MRVKRQFMRCQWKYRDNLQSATVQVAAQVALDSCPGQVAVGVRARVRGLARLYVIIYLELSFIAERHIAEIQMHTKYAKSGPPLPSSATQRLLLCTSFVFASNPNLLHMFSMFLPIYVGQLCAQLH